MNRAMVWLLFAAAALGQERGLVSWWKFDEAAGAIAADTAAHIQDNLHGNTRFVAGVDGSGLKFDGFTGYVSRVATAAPKLSTAFSVEAWIAIQEYPLNWVAVVDHEKNGRAGYRFGLDARGHLGLQASIGGKWRECVSPQPLSLLKWHHVIASWDERKGMSLFVDGRPAGSLQTEGSFTAAPDAELRIGKNLEPLPAADLVRPKVALPALYSFDGIIDELKIYDRALSAEEIVAHAGDVHPAGSPLTARTWPRVKSPASHFGAVYTALDFYPEWDALWRTGPYADIVVGFAGAPYKMVFWRGTNYNANLVTENGIWVGDQSAESSTKWGCAEHMSDKQDRYSHVRVIENTPARVVVHWRYALTDVTYTIAKVDPETGWGNWADEYYYIYPDGVAVRKIRIWGQDKHYSVTEPAILNEPGRKAEDSLEVSAVTLANLKGETHIYRWDPWPTPTQQVTTKKGTHRVNVPLDRPADALIALLHTKSRYQPFYVYPPGTSLLPYGAPDEVRPEFSRFPTWNHWPVNMAPSDGRYAFASDRFSSSAVLSPDPAQTTGPGPTKNTAFLIGLSDQPAEAVVRIARAWSTPATLRLSGKEFRSEGYDRGQRAYVLVRQAAESAAPVEFVLESSAGSPLANPALVIHGWGDRLPDVSVDGKRLEPGRDFRRGLVPQIEGTDAIVSLRLETTKPVQVRVTYASGVE